MASQDATSTGIKLHPKTQAGFVGGFIRGDIGLPVPVTGFQPQGINGLHPDQAQPCLFSLFH